MASGFSVTGRTHGRCYPFFSDFVKCFTSNEGQALPCMAYRADYFECLHHTKEISRAVAIDERKRDLAAIGQWPPKPGTIYDPHQVDYQMFPTWQNRE